MQGGGSPLIPIFLIVVRESTQSPPPPTRTPILYFFDRFRPRTKLPRMRQLQRMRPLPLGARSRCPLGRMEGNLGSCYAMIWYAKNGWCGGRTLCKSSPFTLLLCLLYWLGIDCVTFCQIVWCLLNAAHYTSASISYASGHFYWRRIPLLQD